MSNRVIKDSIWSSPTLAELSTYHQDQLPRWLLMADDWGCFNADPDIIKGIAYPKREETPKKIQETLDAFNKVGLLFTWIADSRTWGFFTSWNNHHNFCNKTNLDDGKKRMRHKRKTPEPPEKELKKYLNKF